MVVRKTPIRHTVRTHTRLGKLVKAHQRGSGTHSFKRQKRVGGTLKYPFKMRELADDECLEWMKPRRYLTEIPHPVFGDGLPGMEKIPASFQLEKHQGEKYFNKGSIEYLTDKIKKGEDVGPLFLDYSQMFRGWPTHEGRHRAVVAWRLGIGKVPVIVKGRKCGGVG